MSVTDLRRFAASLAGQRTDRAAFGLTEPAVRSPDEAAEHRRVGAALGLPSSVVAANPQQHQRRLEQQEAAESLREAPRIAEWLSDPENATLGRDDVGVLASIERDFGAIGRAIGRGSRSVAAGGAMFDVDTASQMLRDLGRTRDEIYREEIARRGGVETPGIVASAMQAAQYRFDQVAGLTDEDRQALVEQGAARLARAGEIMETVAELELSPAAAGFRDETLAQAENTVGATLMAFVHDPLRGAAFLGETAAETLPILAAGSAVTLATRTPAAGAITMAGGGFLRENVSGALDLLDERGIDISTPEAAAAALQDSQLMADAQNRGVTRGLIIALFDAASGGVAGQALMRSPAGDLVAQGLAQSALGAGGEATAQLATTGEIDAREVVIEGLAEMVTAPIEVLGVGGRALGDRIAQTQQEASYRATLDRIDAAVEQSALRGRDPEAFLNAMEAAGGADADILVPARGVRELFQDSEMTLDEGLAFWGIDDADFEAAEFSGGDVSIPVSNYTARISGTPEAEWVRQNAVFDAGALTPAEISDFNARSQEIMQQAFEEMERDAEAERLSRAGEEQVYDIVRSELRTAGRSPDVAEREAAVIAAFWRTMAERMGTEGDALDFFQQRGLTIQGPMTPEVSRRRNALDIQLATLRSQGERALQPTGLSIADFVRAEGGVEDRGGDVAELELPGLVAETAEESRARRSQPSLDGSMPTGGAVSLEDMARRVTEAGYWPDLLSEVNDGSDDVATDLVARLLEALSEEAAGRPTYLEGEGADQALSGLHDALQAAGVDLSEGDNDGVVEALENADARGQDRVQATSPVPASETAITNEEEQGAAPPVLVGQEIDDASREDQGTASSDQEIQFPQEVLGFPVSVNRAVWDRVFTQSPQVLERFLKESFKTTAVPRSRILNPDIVFNPIEHIMARVAGFALEAQDLNQSESERHARLKILEDLAGHMANGFGVPLWKDTSFLSVLNDLRDNEAAISDELIAYFHRAAVDVAREAVDFSSDSASALAFDLVDQAREFYQFQRGSILLPQGGMTQGQTVINLFETANLSTFLHESGHYFLEAFTELASQPDAPQQMRDDMAAIRKHLKNEGGAWTTDQHETWARLTEAYMMEGKAPSLALADAFARFKAWLTRIYRSLAGLNVTPTSEIREVMDRMLATDHEIAEARDAQAISPLFGEAPPGMSEADWRTYQRMARQSEEQAQQRLMDKTMAAVRRRTEKWWKEERRAVHAEVSERINRQPVYRLTEALANGRWIGNEEADLSDMRMDRAALVDMFGEGVLREMDRSRTGGRRAIYRSDGEDPRVTAEFFGFPSVQDMVEAIQNAGKRRDAIETETDRIMTERHGDPLNDGSIEEEALAAIHSDRQAETVTAEIRHIADRMGRDTRNIRSRVYRARARALIGSMTVKQASRPHNFLAAERRAARTAQNAFARASRNGGRQALAEARQAKEQQLLNHFLYEEARRVEDMVRKGRERMRSFGEQKVRQRIGSPHIDQIDALLEGYEFRQRSERQIGNTESLLAYVEAMQAQDRGGELNIDPRVMEEARRRHYSRMSVEELQGLFDTIDNIEHIGRRTQKVVTRRRTRELNESAARVAQSIMGSQPVRDSGRSTMGRNGINLLSRPDTIMVRLDGGQEFGPVYDEIKRDLDSAQVEEQQLNVAMMSAVSDVFSQHFKKKELRALGQEVSRGEHGAWSKEQILMLALNSGTESNFQRLTDRNVDERQRLSPDRLDALLGTLDERDWRFVQDIWDLIEGYWPDVSEVSRRRTGVTPEKVEAKPMWPGAPDFVTGGYFRLFYDADLSDQARRDEQSLFDEQISAGWGASAQVNNGMTKAREATASGRAVRLSFSSITQQLRETARMVTLSEAVDASARILRHKDVTAAMKATGNNDTLQTLEIWLQDLASGPVYNTDLVNSAARLVKNNFTLSRLAFNFKTVILQATGISQSAVTIGAIPMVRGMGQYARRPRATTQAVLEKSGFMQERQSTFQKDIMDFRNEVATASPVVTGWRKSLDGISRWGFEPIVRMQFHVVDVPTWLGAYEAGLDAGKSEDQAVQEADRLVARAQDSGLLGDRSAVERGSVSRTVRQADVIRMFTALAGYMLTKLNRANVVTLQARMGLREADTGTAKAIIAAKMAGDLMVLFAFEAVVMGLGYSLLTEEEEDEDLAKFVFRETALATVAGIPVVRDIASATQGFAEGGVYGTSTNTFAAAFRQAAQGEADESALRAGLNLVGLATGLPSTASYRVFEQFIGDDDASLAEAMFGRNPLEN